MTNLVLFFIESKGEYVEINCKNFKILICYMFQCNFAICFKFVYLKFNR